MVYVRLMSFSENTDAPWRVGVLFSQTGVTAAVEQSQLNATLLAIEEINSSGGVLDRMIEPVIYDPASDPN
jgi:branched-chain amino acid transport system substrate-binding protein